MNNVIRIGDRLKRRRIEQIAAAVRALDPDDDENWREDGAPRIGPIEEITRSAGVVCITREEVDKAAPGWNRDAAEAAASA